MNGQGCEHEHDAAIAQAPLEFHEAAKRVRNWKRWGPNDELGTLNHITPEAIRHAASPVRRGKVISCGVPYNAYGSRGAHGIRRNPIHGMTVGGGDRNMHDIPKEWRGPTEQCIAELIASTPGRSSSDRCAPSQAVSISGELDVVQAVRMLDRRRDRSFCGFVLRHWQLISELHARARRGRVMVFSNAGFHWKAVCASLPPAA